MKSFLFWVLAIIITLSAVVFQRKTGPTNPKLVSFLFDSVLCKTALVRTLEIEGVTSNIELEIDGISNETNLQFFYKRYPSDEEFSPVMAIQSADLFTVKLPSQPPAGKIAYYLVLSNENSTVEVNINNPVILRFKKGVPAGVLLPHILLMFLAMLFANYTGIIAFTNSDKLKKYTLFTLISLIIGGLIFGPFVQYFAFGQFWTGWPLGEDLTDNKTLFLVIFWLVAYLLNRKKPRKYLIIIAAILTLAVYSIPHSTRGSEYKYSKSELNI